MSKLVVGSIQPAFQWVLCVFLGVKWLGCEVNHSPTSGAPIACIVWMGNNFTIFLTLNYSVFEYAPRFKVFLEQWVFKELAVCFITEAHHWTLSQPISHFSIPVLFKSVLSVLILPAIWSSFFPWALPFRVYFHHACPYFVLHLI